MRILNGKKIVARSYEVEGMPMGFRAEPSVQQIELPLTLFGLKNREVNMEQFIKWCGKRCFPPERYDADRVLKSLGLKEYNVMDIVRITGARLIGADDIWVDFDNT